MENTLFSKIIINGEHEYKCYPLFCNEDEFTASLHTEDVMNVIENTKTIEYVDIYNYEGLLEKHVTDFNKASSVSFTTENGNTVVQIVLQKTSVFEKVKELDEKINGGINEADMTLEEYQDYKILQSKAALADYLAANPLVSAVKGGVEAEYSITAEKQGLMSTAYLTYLIKKQVNPEDAKLMWNASGEICQEWSEGEFLTLVLEIENRVHPLVSYQQEIESKIKAFTDKADIAAIKFDFDSVKVEVEDDGEAEVTA